MVDAVKHVLMLFTRHHDGVDDRARRLAAIRTAWPGWRVRWAYGGVEDLVAHLGFERASVRAASRAQPVPRFDDTDALDLANTLVTIRLADGSVRGHRLHSLRCEPLWAGPALLDSLTERTAVPAWELLSEYDVGPDLGLHFDVASRELGYWTVMSLYGTVEEIADRWPGWEVGFWEDRHEEQALRCGSEFRTYPFAST